MPVHTLVFSRDVYFTLAEANQNMIQYATRIHWKLLFNQSKIKYNKSLWGG